MSRTGRPSPGQKQVPVSDLRSQLLAKFGGTAPPAESPMADASDAKDVLHAEAHLGTEWLGCLVDALRGTPIELNSRPSLGAARHAHDLLVKHLKTVGDKRSIRTLTDLRMRFEKKREKAAWTALKRELADAGMGEKLYRSLKQSKTDPSTLLSRWSKLKHKGLSQSDLRQGLIGG